MTEPVFPNFDPKDELPDLSELRPEKITSLTPEQEVELDRIAEWWLQRGLSTEPANRELAEEGVREAYTAAGLTPPRHVIWVGSPYAGALALGIVPQAITAAQELVDKALKDVVNNPSSALMRNTYTMPELSIDPEAVRDWWRSSTYGQHSAGYYAYLSAMEYIGVKGLEPIHGSMKVAQNAGWWWPGEEFVIITERPSQLHYDNQGRLHHETGPAVLYPDGWGVYVWHGTRVPQDLIEGKWTTERIIQEPNAETRRCAIEKMGWDNFVVAANLKMVGKPTDDPANPGHMLELYDVPADIYGQPIRILLCDNATPERDGTRRRFGITVEAACKDPVEAAAWTFSLTKAEYLKLEHAY